MPQATAAMISWGLGARQTHDAQELVSLVQWCEAAGFERFWYGNEKLYPDMIVGLTLAATHSATLRLGTYVADPFSVHPALTAAAVATLEHIAPGRLVLLVGAGGSGLRELGIERRHPAPAVEEAVVVMRRLLAGEVVNHEGPTFRVVDTGIHFPLAGRTPVWVASRGFKVLEAAGRTADGVMIGTYARARDIAAARDHVLLGARSVGRDPSGLTLSVRVDVALSNDREAARDAVRSFIAGVLSASYPDRGFVEQAGLEMPGRLEEVCRTKDIHLAWQSGDLVPNEFVDAFAWAGTPDDVLARVGSVVDLGITEITVMLHPGEGQTLQDQLSMFAESVMARAPGTGSTPTLEGARR